MHNGEDATKQPGEKGSPPDPSLKDQPTSPVNEATSPPRSEGASAEVRNEAVQQERRPPVMKSEPPPKKQASASEVASEPTQKTQSPTVSGETPPPGTQQTTSEVGGASTQKVQPPTELKGEPSAQTADTKPAARTGEKTSVTVKQAPLVRVRSSFYTWCKVHNVLPCDESLRWYLAPLREVFEELCAFDENAKRAQRAEIEGCLTRLEPLTSSRWDGMVGAALLAGELDVDLETQRLGTLLASWSCALRGVPHTSFEAVFPTRSAASEHGRYTRGSATVEVNKDQALFLSAVVGSPGACLCKADTGQEGDPNEDPAGRLLCADLLASALLKEPLIDSRRLDDAWASIIEPAELGTLRGWHADEHDMSASSSAAGQPYPLAAAYARHWAAWNDAVTSSSAHVLSAPADKLVEEEGCTIEAALGPRVESTSRKKSKPTRLRLEYTSGGADRAVLDLGSGLVYLTHHYEANPGTQHWVPLALTPRYQAVLEKLAGMAARKDQVADASVLSPTICFVPPEKADILPIWSVNDSKRKKKDKKQAKPALDGQPLRALCHEIDSTVGKLKAKSCPEVLAQLGWITNGYSTDRSGGRRSGWVATQSYQVLEDDFAEAIARPLASTAQLLAKTKSELTSLVPIVAALQGLAKSAGSTDVPEPKRRADLVAAYCLTNLLRFRLYQEWMDDEIRTRALAGKKVKLSGAKLDTEGTQGDHMLNDLWSGFGRFAALSGFNVPMPMALRRWLRAARRFRSYKWTDTTTGSAPHPFGPRFGSSIGDPNSQLWSWAERACPLLASLAPESGWSEAERSSASAKDDSKQPAHGPKEKGSEKATQDGLVPEERRARLLSLEESARAACRRATEVAKDAKARKDGTEARAGLRQASREAAFATDYLQRALALCPGAPTPGEAVQGVELVHQLAAELARAVAALLAAVEGSPAKSDWAGPCRDARDAVASARDAADASRQATSAAAEGGDCTSEARAALGHATTAVSAADEAARALLEVISAKGSGGAVAVAAKRAAAAAKLAQEQVDLIPKKRAQARLATADLMYCALHVLVASSLDTSVLTMHSLDPRTSGSAFFYLHGGENGEDTPPVEAVMPSYAAMLEACEQFAVQMAEIAVGRRRSHAAYTKDKATLVRTTWGSGATSSKPAANAQAQAQPEAPPTAREVIGIRNEGNQCYRNAALQLCAALDMQANFLPQGHHPAPKPVVQGFIDGLRPAARAADYLLAHDGNPATAYSHDFDSTDAVRRAMSVARGWPAYSQQDAADALRWIFDQCERPVAADDGLLDAYNLGFRALAPDVAVDRFKQVIPHKLAMLFEQRVTFTHPNVLGGAAFSITFREAPRSMLEIPIRGARSMAELIATELDYTDVTRSDNQQDVQYRGLPYQNAQPVRRVWSLLSDPPERLVVQLKRFVGRRVEVQATQVTEQKSAPSPSTEESVSPQVKESKKEQKEKEAEKPKVQFVLEKCEVPVTGAADVVGIEFTRDVSNYRLIAFVVHLGDTLEEGHYVAYVQANGHWYKVNDDVVTEDAPEWQQMAEIGYLYLYEKVA